MEQLIDAFKLSHTAAAQEHPPPLPVNATAMLYTMVAGVRRKSSAFLAAPDSRFFLWSPTDTVMSVSTRHFPQRITHAATSVWEALTPILGECLSMGGGTVLAARWNHRISTDVDLFVPPGRLESLTVDERLLIEKKLTTIPGCDPSRTWANIVAVNCEIAGTPVSVRMMHERGNGSEQMEVGSQSASPRLQNTSDILHAKLAHRMLLTQKFLIRDLYDVACAEIHDKKGLRLALSRLARREIKHIRAGTRSLSDDWMENDPQKLIGPAYDWGMGEICQRVENVLESDDGWRRNKESEKAR
ncbi:MAG: hypothetical protein OXE48_04605 [Gammaproteobacteria bacterium]|nr:hypothetical protein [Gammaproteobacteria bacterium]